MYQFYDEIVHKLYADRHISLLLSDTDSFIFQVYTDDVYKDMAHITDQLDTSNYDKSHFLYNERNRMVPGKFKDEVPLKYLNDKACLIQAFIGLKSKMYNILLTTGTEFKRAKGVKKNSLRKISFQDFKDTIFLENVISFNNTGGEKLLFFQFY